MSNGTTVRDLLGPISLSFSIERALWGALIETHPNPQAFREAWAIQLPQLLEDADDVIARDPAATRQAFLEVLADIGQMIESAAAMQAAKAIHGKPIA